MTNQDGPDQIPAEWDEPALFDLGAPQHAHGRVRRGVDADALTARDAGQTLPAAGLAALQTLADQIDQLERQLRYPKSKPYDRVPLAGLVKEFRETYGTVFMMGGADDPFARALSDFLAVDGDTAVRDAPGPEPAD